MKIKKLKIPFYHCSFSIIIYDNDNKLQDKFKNFHFEPPIDTFDGGVFEIDGHLYIALRQYQKNNIQYPTVGIIAHESKHLVNRVFLYIQQNLDLQNDEAECYFLEWVVNQCYDFLNTK